MAWFDEAGGTVSLRDRLAGLDPVLNDVAGKTLLDLGAAEGCIAIKAARQGAALCHAVERDVDTFRRGLLLSNGLPVLMMRRDMNNLHAVEAPPVLKHYDVVLMLGLAQKLDNPAAALRWAARRASTLAVRVPAPVFQRKADRGDSAPLYDVVEIVGKVGARLQCEAGSPTTWLGIFKREAA